MAAPAKFLFDLDFAAPDMGRAPVITPDQVAAQIANAEAQAYRAGFDAAQQETKAEADRRMALALEQIGISAMTVAQSVAGIETKMETEAVDIAVAVARKLCGELVAREPLTEIMALVLDCFRHLVATPHLVIRVNDALYEEAKERIEKQARQSGFAGRLVILAEPDIDNGDCKIEWADGGMALERTAIDAKINELVGRYMASRNPA